jgi:hypothetical protein
MNGSHTDAPQHDRDQLLLLLQRLISNHDWFWVAGLPLASRAPHHQLLLGHERSVTERMDMHLVCLWGRIFFTEFWAYFYLLQEWLRLP